MTLPSPILHVLLTLSLLTNLTLAPILPQEQWQPDPNDITLIAQTVWGEYRGSDYDQRVAVVWCILNRVEDGRFPDTIEGVVRQPSQFHGFSPDNPTTFADEVRDILIRWHEGEHGIDPSLCWFWGDGHQNHYRNAWKAEEATLFWP